MNTGHFRSSWMVIADLACAWVGQDLVDGPHCSNVAKQKPCCLSPTICTCSYNLVRETYISKMCNCVLKMDSSHSTFSSFSNNNPTEMIAIFHHQSKYSTMWSCCNNISQICSVVEYRFPHLFQLSPLDNNWVNSFMNCCFHIKTILNYLLPWDIEYTQACRTPITKLWHLEKMLIRFGYITTTNTSSTEWNNLHGTQGP